MTSHLLPTHFSRILPTAGTIPEETICIVEDESSFRMLLKAILTQAGYAVLTAEDGNVALEMVERHHIDLILLDIQMPGINGFEVCKKIIAERDKARTIPIIFVSAFEAIQNEEQALQEGAVDFIEKPIVPALLLARIKTQLELHRARRELWGQNEKLIEFTNHLALEIEDRCKAEESLRDYQMRLEGIVDERTAELLNVNRQLQQEIEERKQTEKALKTSQLALGKKSTNLEEANIALKILLDKREQERRSFEEQVSEKIMHLVEPYLEKLIKSDLDERQRKLAELIALNLQDVLSPLVRCAVAQNIKFSPVETQVATFIKQGKSSKEIAEFMCISPRTVDVHRRNIRKKIGVVNKKINLQTLLSSPDLL